MAIGWELVLLAAIVYVPALREPFKTSGLAMNDWLLIAGLAFTVVPVLEAVKWMERHGWLGDLA
jgi:Ca2+-transporting ATPase